MSGVPYHAWTHRPKADGGTDPIEQAGSTFKYIVCKDIGTGQTLASGNSNLLWQVNVQPNPECFTPQIFSGSNYYRIRMLEDGFFTVTCSIRLFHATIDHPFQLSIYTPDPSSGPQTHRTMYGEYNHLAGFDDASFIWTFRMDGTGGSNRVIEFQFENLVASSIAGDHCYIEVIKHPGTIGMTGRDRDTNPG